MTNSIGDIFLELASDTRISILKTLETNSCRASKLSKSLNLTAQETHRNLERLVESDLVIKKSDSFLTLTSYGKVVVQNISVFNFLHNNKKYFLNHSTTGLNEKFIQRLGDLNDSHYVKGVFVILETWKDIAKNAKKYIKVISSEIPVTFFPILVDMVQKGVIIYQIHGENTIVPTNFKEKLTDSNLRKLIVDKKFQRKMIKKVTVIGVINETECSLSFPYLNEIADIDGGFASKNPKAQGWFEDYFDEVWKNADDYDVSKIKTE